LWPNLFSRKKSWWQFLLNIYRIRFSRETQNNTCQAGVKKLFLRNAVL
jgi:hypothetical protein